MLLTTESFLPPYYDNIHHVVAQSEDLNNAKQMVISALKSQNYRQSALFYQSKRKWVKQPGHYWHTKTSTVMGELGAHIFLLLFNFIYLSMSGASPVWISMYHMYVLPKENIRGCQISWDCNSRCWVLSVVLGIKPESCGRAVRALSYWAISPAPVYNFFHRKSKLTCHWALPSLEKPSCLPAIWVCQTTLVSCRKDFQNCCKALSESSAHLWGTELFILGNVMEGKWKKVHRVAGEEKQKNVQLAPKMLQRGSLFSCLEQLFMRVYLLRMGDSLQLITDANEKPHCFTLYP